MSKKTVTLNPGDEITIKIKKVVSARATKPAKKATTKVTIDPLKAKIYKEIDKREKKGLAIDSSDIAMKLGCKKTTVAACKAHHTMRTRKAN